MKASTAFGLYFLIGCVGIAGLGLSALTGATKSLDARLITASCTCLALSLLGMVWLIGRAASYREG